MSDMIETSSTNSLPESFAFLTKGYLEYAEEVIRERAIIGIDGLTPSQRRVLVAMHDIEQVKSNTKCASVVGATMKLHPHGDATIYQTLCKMTDVSERMNIPLIKGKGKFQKVYSNEPSSASRYTECMLMPVVEEYFNDSTGVEMIPNYDNSRTEPALLGVSYPSLLCNPTLGVAVGIASNIPSFNYHDVLNATIELIETGKISKPLVPDFSSPCSYVYDEKELNKIMRNGKGRIKLRGEWRVEGKTIIITQIPYYTTLQRIEKAARGIDGVVKPRDLSGFVNGKTSMLLHIECSNKECVDSILQQLLKSSDLQMSFTTNIAVIIDGKPRTLGVTELLAEWVKFRKGVLYKKYTLERQNVEYNVNRFTYITKLLEDVAVRDAFMAALFKSESNAETILRQKFPEIDKDTCNWILDMKVRQFSQLEKYKAKLADFIAYRDEIDVKLNDLEAEIVRQLKVLNTKYSFPRKTVITDKDYTFENVKAESFDVTVTIQDKFIKKEVYSNISKYLTNKSAVHCKSDDFIICIDDLGRLLRINLSNIPVTPTGNRGVYIPSYCEIADNFNIIDYDVMQPKNVNYMYKDGYVSAMNYGQYCGNKKITKVTTSGVPDQTGIICGKFNDDYDYIYVMTNLQRFAFIPNEFLHKSSTARTKFVGGLRKNEYILGCKGMSATDVMHVMPNFMEHTTKLEKLKPNEIFDKDYFASIK